MDNYIIVESKYSCNDLAETVNKKILEGYIPVGGIAFTGEKMVANVGNFNTYSQAMMIPEAE